VNAQNVLSLDRIVCFFNFVIAFLLSSSLCSWLYAILQRIFPNKNSDQRLRLTSCLFFISEVCEVGFYGVNCEEECGRCKDDLCSDDDGHCSDGCQIWFIGDLCKEEIGEFASKEIHNINNKYTQHFRHWMDHMCF
jgi:hypothetical protein